MSGPDIFSPFTLGPLTLPNRVVMAPMTRNRAGPGNVPVELNATYYAQRASAGLIISEATQVSPQGIGYPGTPGIHSPEQVAGWKLVTDAVHKAKGRIYLQLWHVGRISHPSLQPDNMLPVAPSAITPAGEAFIENEKGEGQFVPFVRPRALLLENVRGLSTDRFGAYRQHVLDRLRELGYVPGWRLLQASDFGVPQLRPRTILVALRPEDAPWFRWPSGTGLPPGTVGSTVADLMASRGWRGAAAWALRADRIAPTIVGGSKKHGGADLGPTRAKRAWATLGVDGMGIADQPPARHRASAKTPDALKEVRGDVDGAIGQGFRTVVF